LQEQQPMTQLYQIGYQMSWIYHWGNINLLEGLNIKILDMEKTRIKKQNSLTTVQMFVG